MCVGGWYGVKGEGMSVIFHLAFLRAAGGGVGCGVLSLDKSKLKSGKGVL